MAGLTVVPANSNGINFVGVQPTLPSSSLQGSSPNLQGGGGAIVPTVAAAPQTNNTGGGTGGSVGGSINTGYDQYLSGLQGILGGFDAQQGNAQGIVNNQYGANLADINTNYDTGARHLDAASNQITTNQQRGLRDLASQIRDAFSAGQNRIGNAGAGDSSAVGQYAYALTKLQNQNSGQLQQQASDQQAQVGLQRADLDSQKGSLVNQLNTWKANQIYQIANDFAAKRQQIQLEMASASRDRQVALAQQSQALSQNALANLSSLQNTYAGYQAQIGATGVDPSKLGQINYSPQALSTGQVSPLQIGGNPQQSVFGVPGRY